MTDELLRPADVAAEWNISVGTLKSWRSSGSGPAWFRLGTRRIVYERAEVERWVESQKRASAVSA